MSADSQLKEEEAHAPENPNDAEGASQLNLDDIQTTPFIFNKACDILLSIPLGAEPTAFDLTSTCLLLAYSHEAEQSKTVHAVCHAAMSWGRVDLWGRAIKSCCESSSVAAIQALWIFEGIIRFGFEAVRPTLEELKQNSQLARSLFALIDTLNTRINTAVRVIDGPRDAENLYGDEAIQWINKSHEELIRSIGRAARDECDKLIHKSLTSGGLVYLKDTAIPVCVEVCPTDFLKELGLRIHRDGVFPPSALKQDVILACFRSLLTKLNHPEDADVSDYQRLAKATSSQTIALFKAIIKAGILDIANELISELCTKLRGYMENIVDERETAMSGIINLLSELQKDRFYDKLPSQSSDSPLFELVCNILLDDMSAVEEIYPDLCDHRASRQAIAKLAEMHGGLQALLKSISQKMSQLRTPTTMALVVQLKNWDDKIDSIPDLHDAYTALIQHYIKNAPLSTMEQIKIAAGVCCELESPAAIQVIADRLVSPGRHRVPSAATEFVPGSLGPQVGNNTNFKTVLKWVLGVLQSEAQQAGFLNRIGPALNTLILSWIQADIDVAPLAAAPDLGRVQLQVKNLWVSKCLCAYCMSVQSFFLELPCEMVAQLVKIPAEGAEHVKKAINKYTPVDGKPVVDVEHYVFLSTLWIIKRPNIFQPALFPPFHKSLLELLQTISASEVERDQILGPTNGKITRWLRSSQPGNKRASTPPNVETGRSSKKKKILP